ncbi:transcriptional regulator [Cellulomonas composti]|uniref:Transcriptional regulator n=1 Tax=Cellulomonas composti TaxID=266130 RepID=A0A511JB09_9CELL|nr:transcriptional regulator [Cellulomonas composti]
MLRGTALVTVALLAFGGTAVYATYARLTNNIRQVDVSALLGPRPTPSAVVAAGDDPNAGQDVNILLLGSDSRMGENGDIGGRVTGGMRSDTAIVMHISADRSRVEMVSIPRDSLVEIPSCNTSTGEKTNTSSRAMFNEAFARGWDTGLDLESAAACAWLTVEKNTGLVIDNFALVDFAGFEDMVDAIDGVPICIPVDLDDNKAKLHLTAGYQTLRGKDALAFARSRHNNASDGSDIGRIGNQQRLLAAMATEILHKDVLANWTQLLGLLNAATRSITTSMSTTDIAGLGYSMRGVRGGDITLMTVPWGTPADDKNRVEWTSEADIVWANMAADVPILDGTSEEPEASATPSATPSASATPGATATPGKSATPKPKATRKAGREAFTLDDSTASCTQ